MSLRQLEVDEALVGEVCARLRRQLPEREAALATAFVRQYYRWVSPDDLASRSPLDVYGAALSHFTFAQTRLPGTVKARVYNPEPDSDGWQSTHTAVEIVTDDMPFLIDSVSMELNRRGFGVHLIIHPVMNVRRDAGGELLEVLVPGPAESPDGIPESIIHAEVDRHTLPAQLEALRDRLVRVIGEVRAAVEDWKAMRRRALDLAAELREDPSPLDGEEVAEAAAFLTWLEDHSFTFLGYRDYDVVTDGDDVHLKAVAGSGLGILRGEVTTPTQEGFAKLPARVRALALEPYLLNLTKANSRATVHRPAYLDYVGVKHLDRDGGVVGERRFLGLYTHTAYHASPREIPILRRKVDAVLARAAFPPDSHNEKALTEILETHPRDELLQATVDELFEIAIGILYLGERQRVRLFVRRDTFGRFFSCLVFVPRDRFNTENRRQIERILAQSFDALSIDYTTRVSESVLVRLHYMVYTDPSHPPDVDVAAIEARVTTVTRSWADDLQAALIEDQAQERGHALWRPDESEQRGNELWRRYRDAFPTAYRADWPAAAAAGDVRRIEDLPVTDGLAITLYRPDDAPPGGMRAKLLRSGPPLALSDIVPTLENMGVKVGDERPYEVTPLERPPVWIYDVGLTYEGASELEAGEVRAAFEEAFVRAWRGDVENDGYNRLVLRARLTWREITVLRALARYLRQAGTTFSDTYVEQALVSHPDVARLLVKLFRVRFDPDAVDRDAAVTMVASIEQGIDAVESLDQDRILRCFLDGVQAMLRTNYFQHPDGGEPNHLSFKLDPSRLSWLPLPRPQFEVFVYSPRMEGVHLRGGRVARGGIRSSDRREDFRTEVLGLMKAQMVKNSVIVPVGAKGGFIVKRPAAGVDRAQQLEAVATCYRIFIRGLLDLTDNIVEGEIVPPPEVVRYDGDDPYLVVAADKGTATFSDVANGIAQEYGFWLGDAFASGGSSGYDHKRMGITARGAWESVQRHFRELGHDVQEQDFTVVGIGDMSGDVFGNGMLLSRHIRLVAAFNHRDIFIDPDPDAEKSFKERVRLFALPRSGWTDYDAKKISRGGGVFPRSAKSITLSPEAREVLGLDAETIAPNDLIRSILRCPVDLLWNGGIGTYVKSSAEISAHAGDKSNDAVRVDARELRCRVVGEGGNLGLTQRSRIEYALAGGRINTDAIDNSAGVDCSDHEVNIKILLDPVVADGGLTETERNALLVEMTDEVAELVLKDNYEQTETISLAESQAVGMLDVHARLIHSLEQSRKLDRELEMLPSEEALAERRRDHRGLSRPELATLLAYSKIDLYAELLDSDVPEDAYLSGELKAYFPSPLRERFDTLMEGHRLRREIVATQVVNFMLHGGGTTFAFRLHEETGAAASDIARAYTVAREVFAMRPQWAEIEALDNRVDAAHQIAMLLEGRRLVERGTRWLLRNRRRPLAITATVSQFAQGVTELFGAISRLLDVEDAERLARSSDELLAAGVPPALAGLVASLPMMVSALDIVEVAATAGLAVEYVAAVHYRLGGRLMLHWLHDRVVALPREDRWGALARAGLRDDVYGLHRVLTAEVLRHGSLDGNVDDRVDAWIADNPAAERYLQTLADIRVGRVFDMTTLPVALREVRNLIQAPQAAAQPLGTPPASADGASRSRAASGAEAGR